MFPRSLSDRVERLIDELIEEGGLDSASLASILLAGQEAANRGYCLELSRRVWLASRELRPGDREPLDAIAPVPPPSKQGRRTRRRVP